MNTVLSHLLAHPRQRDLVAHRMATAGDRGPLERLAELDSTETLIGATLIGALGGRVVAALSLCDGKVIADPFVASTEIVELLRVRAQQLNRMPASRCLRDLRRR